MLFMPMGNNMLIQSFIKGGDTMPRKKMNHQKQEKAQSKKGKKGGMAMQPQDAKGVNPVIGAAVGAAVGGVVGAAAAVALSDKDTRKKLKVAATNVREQASEKIGEMASRASDAAQKTKEGLPALSQPAKKRSSKA